MSKTDLHGRLVFVSVLVLLPLIALAYRPAVQPQQTLGFQGYHIYFSADNGEASRFDRSAAGVSRLAGLLETLGAELYTLDWDDFVLQNPDLLIMAAPVNDLSPVQTARLWSYLSGGGKLLLIAEPPVRGVRALVSQAPFFNLLWADAGLRARNDVVVTEAGTQVEGANPPQAGMPALVEDFSTTQVNTSHPITANPDGSLLFRGARSIEISRLSPAFQVDSLIVSANSFYGETNFAEYLETGISGYAIEEDTARSALSLAAAASDRQTAVIIIGDREFATNGGGLQVVQGVHFAFTYPGNARFLVNAVSWMLGVGEIPLSLPVLDVLPTPTAAPSPTPTSIPTPSSTGT